MFVVYPSNVQNKKYNITRKEHYIQKLPGVLHAECYRDIMLMKNLSL